MTHAPHDEGGGGGGGGGGGTEQRQQATAAAREVAKAPEEAPDDKQVQELLSPPGALLNSGAAVAASVVAAPSELLAPSSPKAASPVQGVGDAPTPGSLHALHEEENEDDGGGEPIAVRPSNMPTPPDGGWGWVVVFASFMIHIINDGVTYSFGIFYDALIEYFDSGRGETAWILSILVGVTLCSGPISSSFVNRYGCRPVTIAGALLGAASLAVSVFAPNVQTLYVTIGLGTGFGFGLVYLPAIVSVTCYFERLRSLATGIAVCGSGLGTFLLAPATKELVKNLGWRQALLWVSVMVLSCVIYGALFRPLKPEEPKEALEEDQVAASMTASVVELQTKRTPAVTDLYSLKESEAPLHASDRDISARLSSNRSRKEIEASLHRPRSVGHLAGNTMSSGAILVPPRVAQRGGGPASRLALSQPTLAYTVAHTSGTETRLATPSMYRRTGSGIMYRKDILYSGSVHNLLEHKSTSHLHSEAARLLSDDAVPLSRHHTSPPPSANGVAAPPAALDASADGGHGDEAKVPRQKKACGCLKLSAETTDALREMLDFSLLKDPIFILFTISNFLTSIGYNVPYLYVTVQAKTRGLDDTKAGWLLAAIGFANTIGRIVLGYISDKPWVNRLLVYNLCLTICGIATAFSALCTSYESFMLYACVFGCTIGAYVGLTSVVLVDLLGLDRLTNAFGLLLLFQGIASFIGPPIAGWLYDALKSYDPGFIVAGVTMALSGVMLFIIPPVQRRLRLKAAAAGNSTVLELRQPANGSARMVHA